MATLTEEFQALAEELINGDFVEAKYDITLTNAGTDYDPDTGATTGGESQALQGTVIDYSFTQFDGSNIKVGDQFVQLLNSEVTINIKSGTTSFSLSFKGTTTAGKVINQQVDPLNITTLLQLRAG